MRKILVFALLLCILTGCQEKTLLAEQQGLHNSILEYYKLTNQSYKSKNLEVKIELVKVETEENIYYRYLVTFVPLYFESISFKDVAINFHNIEMRDYINREPLIEGYESFSLKIDNQTSKEYFKYKNIEDFRCLLWSAYLKIPKKVIAKKDYTIEQFEDMLTNFDLMISFNKFKDTLEIKNLEILVTEDSVNYFRNDIDNMRNNISPQNYFTTYTSEEENIDFFIKK